MPLDEEKDCPRCHVSVTTDEGCEPTEFCHHCAQALRAYQTTRTLAEMALDLCHAIEAQPPCEAQTKCSLLASDLRRALEDYQLTRPLTAGENAMIYEAWKQHSASRT